MTTEDNPDPPIDEPSGLEFVETPIFTTEWGRIGLDDEALRALQTKLLIQPAAGDVIRQSGGLRKIRVPAKGKGSRGGARVIYAWHPEDDQIILLLPYPKNEKDDLTPKQLRGLRLLAAQ